MKNIGGQAVIEGVMMKSSKGWSVAVRGPNGDISIKTEHTKKQAAFLRLPFVRGIVALTQAISIGIKAIEFSGNIAYQEEDKKPIGPWGFGLSIGAALLLAVGIFKFLPLWAAAAMSNLVDAVAKSSVLFNLIDGVVRVCLFLFYVFIIGLWKEMRRIYEYHGAEHKVIYAYEANEDLTIENVKKYKPYHPRCGTSFLLIVMIISIIVFIMIPQQWTFMEKLISRLILIPAIAGISYEVMRFSAKKKDNKLMGTLILPGLLLQRLTVREPDDSQIEVAITAIKEVLTIDREAINNAR